MSSIGIVGAGIAGLALALALRQCGIEQICVYEQTNQPNPADDLHSWVDGPASERLTITPNATRVLRALGLRRRLDILAEMPIAQQQRAGGNGFLMSELPLGDLAERRFGAPLYCIGYDDLHQLLLQAARDAGVEIRFGHTCTGKNNGQLWFSKPPGRKHSLFVGADGAASVLRKSVLPEHPAPVPSGHCWRAQVPLADVPESLRKPTLSYWLGVDHYLQHNFSSKHSRLYLFGATQQQQVPEPADLRACFQSWQPLLVSMLTAASAHRVAPLWQQAPPTAVAIGNLALIGDAAHAMAPHLGQAAALALEDAWVLSRFIDQHEDDPVQACAQYQRYRLRRVQLMVTRSWQEGQQRMGPAGLSRALEQLTTSLSSRFLPELALQRLDWIYRYDCIRGFE